MAVGIDGMRVLILVEVASVWTAVAAQTGLTRETTREMIDSSNKDHDHMRFIYGKQGDTLSLEGLFVPTDTAYAAIRDAIENKAQVVFRRSFDGTEVEEATGLIETLSEEFPDNDVAVYTADAMLDTAWSALP